MNPILLGMIIGDCLGSAQFLGFGILFFQDHLPFQE